MQQKGPEKRFLHPLEEPHSRAGRFASSFAMQSVALVLLLHLGVVRPQNPAPQSASYQTVELVSPSPNPWSHPPAPPLIVPRTLPRAPLPPPTFEAPPLIAETPKPKLPEVSSPPPQPVSPAVAASMFPEKNIGGDGSPKRDRKVATGMFASGSTATATLRAPAGQVQTGGFGDPNGVAPVADAHGAVKIAAVGSFDLPSGPGIGNGSGGAKGARGTVVSAGFGNGVATSTPGEGGLGRGGSVREGGFGNNTIAEKPVPRIESASADASLKPAEILSKPAPVYTPEARRQKIEGEVLLEVVFGASGKVNVVRVLRGLGHGLDEAAIRAAEQIRFKPAQHDGQAVDSTARIHIIFQLT